MTYWWPEEYFVHQSLFPDESDVGDHGDSGDFL
jgi:hypothetical protein